VPTRVVDPSRCWIRHVKRAAPGTVVPFRDEFASIDELSRYAMNADALDDGAGAEWRVDASGLYHTTQAYGGFVAPGRFADHVTEVTFVWRSALTNGGAQVGAFAKWLNRASYIVAVTEHNASNAAALRLYKRAAGTYTTLAGPTGTTATLVVGSTYTMRVAIAGNVVTATLLDAAGATLVTVSHTLAGADATTYGQGVLGRCGIRSNHYSSTNATPYRLRSLAITPAGARTDVAVFGGRAFEPQPLEGVNGRQGWQAAEVTTELGDPGTFTVRFPNAVGDDGRLHRDRFDLLTDPLYRPGDEWLEFYREPHDLLLVGTPVKWKIDGTTLELSGVDARQLLNADRTLEFDPLTHAPADVFEHYSRMTRQIVATDFTTYTGGTLPDGWISETSGPAGAASVAADPAGGVRLTVANGAGWAGLAYSLEDVDLYADEFVAHLRFRDVTYVPGSGGAPTVNPHLLLDNLRGAGGYTAYGWSGTYTGEGYARTYLFGLGGGAPPEGERVPPSTGTLELTLVGRDRHLYLYVNGRLVHHGERAWNVGTLVARRPDLLLARVFENGRAVLEYASLHTRAPALMRAATRGSRRLPGAPTPGGLKAKWYDIVAINQRYGSSALYAHWPKPLEEPRVTTLFPRLEPATWTTPQSLGPVWAARFTGAIYLDLATSDRILRVLSADDASRVWIGKLRFGDRAIFTTAVNGTYEQATGSLREHIGSSEAGWYPIIVDVLNYGGGPGYVNLQDATLTNGVVGTYATIPTSRLSPYGVVDDVLRHESNAEAIATVSDAYGYQTRLYPRSLESGQFPGVLLPLVRAGRDTDLIIDDTDGVQVQAEGDASDTADRLIVDAAGIADPRGAQQLTGTVTLPGAAAAHPFLATGYESLSEISEPVLLQQRAASLLALRGSPNEQVGVQPRGSRELVDAFPLTGALARFDWQPGDGVRLDLPTVAVRDLTPRQIVRVAWPIYPDGVGAPAVGFRQRPRSVREVLRRALRTALTSERNYQGQLAIITGTWGSTSATGGVSGGAVDPFSRLNLPGPIDDLVKLELVPGYTSGITTVYRIEVDGVDTGERVGANTSGPIDVTRYVRRNSNNEQAATRIYAILAGGVGTCEFQLQATVRI
jgi:hypothetical protein